MKWNYKNAVKSAAIVLVMAILWAMFCTSVDTHLLITALGGCVLGYFGSSLCSKIWPLWGINGG